MPVVITLSVEDITDERIRAIAKARRMKLSAVVDAAIELLAKQDEYLNKPAQKPKQNSKRHVVEIAA